MIHDLQLPIDYSQLTALLLKSYMKVIKLYQAPIFLKPGW
jgi:hypothetical protein